MLTSIRVTGLLLLAFAGYIKGMEQVANLVPIDLTLAGAAIVAAFLVPQVLCGGVRQLWPVGVLALAWLPATLGDLSGGYGHEKVTQGLPLVFLSIVGGGLLLNQELARRRWLTGTVALGVIAVSLGLLFPAADASESGVVAIDGSTTIAQGRAAGAAVVVLVLVAIVGRSHRAVLLIGACGLGVGMIASGSRGPVLAAVAAVMVASFFTAQGTRWVRALVVTVGVATATYLAYAAELIADRQMRLDDDSAAARRRLWGEAWDIAGANPLGIGWGQLIDHLSVASVLDRAGQRQYPHNLLLEVASEGGWTAFAALVLLLGLALRIQARAERGPREAAMLGLLLFFLVNAMVSGDLAGNRGLWVTVGAALVWTGNGSVRSGSDRPDPVSASAHA
jgi:hypothetical protein